MNRNLGGSLRGITWFSAFSWGAEGRNYFDCQLTAIRGDHKNVICIMGDQVNFVGKGHVCSSALCFCTIISVTVKGLLLMNILVKV